MNECDTVTVVYILKSIIGYIVILYGITDMSTFYLFSILYFNFS